MQSQKIKLSKRIYCKEFGIFLNKDLSFSRRTGLKFDHWGHSEKWFFVIANEVKQSQQAHLQRCRIATYLPLTDFYLDPETSSG